MTRPLLSALLALGLASGAVAQTVPIRSGWQQSFTRLVFTIPEGIDWTLSRSGADYLLQLGGSGIVYDTRDVFPRIPRERLQRLTQTPEGLRIGLACEPCHARAFLWQEDRLVVDLRDGPPSPDSVFEAAAEEPGDSGPADTAASPDAEPEAPVAPVRLPIVTGSASRSLPALLPDPFAVRTDEVVVLDEAEQALIESIARAASQGLLKPVGDISPRGPETASPAEPQSEPVPPEPMPSSGGAGYPGVAARTSIDRDLAGAEPGRGTPGLDEAACMPSQHFDIEDWGDDRPFHAQMAEARRAMVAEFDHVAPEDALRMARLYLYFGFGTEARQALLLDDQSSRESDIVEEMGHLIDGGSTPRGIFDNQIGCPGAPSLWAVVSRGAIPQQPELDRNGALQYFQRLPPPVQAQIGGRLAESFLDFGDDDAAAILLGRARNGPGGDSEGNRLAEAELAVHYGDAPQTLGELIGTVRTDGRAGPDTLLRIFALSEETGQPMPADLIDLSAALRFEYRGDDVVGDLASAEMRAHLARGDHDRAIETVEDERSRLPEDRLGELLSEAMIATALDAEDVDFLERALSHLPRPISPVAENAVADRLLDLGLAAAAQEVLKTTPMNEAARDRRYLRAEIALQVGDFDQVPDLLVGLDDDRATALRAAALTQSGAYGSAFSLGTPADRSDPEAAWRAGAWGDLSGSEDPDLSAASRLVLDAEGGAEPEGPLSRSRDLLDRSRESRGVLDGLLNRFQVDAAPE